MDIGGFGKALSAAGGNPATTGPVQSEKDRAIQIARSVARDPNGVIHLTAEETGIVCRQLLRALALS